MVESGMSFINLTDDVGGKVTVVVGFLLKGTAMPPASLKKLGWLPLNNAELMGWWWKFTCGVIDFSLTWWAGTFFILSKIKNSKR